MGNHGESMSVRVGRNGKKKKRGRWEGNEKKRKEKKIVEETHLKT